MTQETRAQILEKRIKPEEKQKVFFSYDYKNQAEFRKAIKDYQAVNPESKIKIFEFIGSKENDAGEVTHSTMFENGDEQDE